MTRELTNKFIKLLKEQKQTEKVRNEIKRLKLSLDIYNALI